MSNTKKIFLDVFKTLFFLGLGVLLIWLVVKNLSEKDKSEILAAVAEAKISIILLVMLLGFFSNVSRAIRWQIMMEPLGKKTSFKNTLMAVLVGYLANLAIPRLGEVSRCGIIKRYENLPLDSVLGTVVVERLTDMLLLLIVSVFTIVWQFELLSTKLTDAFHSFFETSTQSQIYLKLVVLLSIVSLCAGLFFFRNKIKQSKIYFKITHLLKGFSNGLKTITQLKKPYLFVFHSLIIWLLYFVGIYIGFNALIATSNLGVGAALAVLFFGTFAFILVQGGIGAYQIIVQNTLLIYGISANVGYALGWIIWSSQTLMVILSGLISFLLLPLLNKNKNGLSTSD
jgi:uncharacterized protein (TIRG00374 family)